MVIKSPRVAFVIDDPVTPFWNAACLLSLSLRQEPLLLSVLLGQNDATSLRCGSKRLAYTLQGELLQKEPLLAFLQFSRKDKQLLVFSQLPWAEGFRGSSSVDLYVEDVSSTVDPIVVYSFVCFKKRIHDYRGVPFIAPSDEIHGVLFRGTGTGYVTKNP